MIEPTVKEATTTSPPAAEAQALTGPTVADLQAQIADLQTKYSKEVGDRDRGMARQADTLKQLTERLSVAEQAADALARQTFGEETTPVDSEYQKWRNQHPAPKTTQPKERPLTPDQAISIGEMKATAKYYQVDYTNPPGELVDVINQVTTLFETDPQKATEVWENGLKKRDVEIKAKAEAEAKIKKEEAEKKAKLGVRDNSTSTGGAGGSYQAIRDAWMKNPNDPATKQAYLEARQARGV